jgi:hypothetical protein
VHSPRCRQRRGSAHTSRRYWTDGRVNRSRARSAQGGEGRCTPVVGADPNRRPRMSRPPLAGRRGRHMRSRCRFAQRLRWPRPADRTRRSIRQGQPPASGSPRHAQRRSGRAAARSCETRSGHDSGNQQAHVNNLRATRPASAQTVPPSRSQRAGRTTSRRRRDDCRKTRCFRPGRNGRELYSRRDASRLNT